MSLKFLLTDIKNVNLAYLKPVIAYFENEKVNDNEYKITDGALHTFGVGLKNYYYISIDMLSNYIYEFFVIVLKTKSCKLNFKII